MSSCAKAAGRERRRRPAMTLWTSCRPVRRSRRRTIPSPTIFSTTASRRRPFSAERIRPTSSSRSPASSMTSATCCNRVMTISTARWRRHSSGPSWARGSPALVRLHVPAKRYLVTTEPRYRETTRRLEHREPRAPGWCHGRRGDGRLCERGALRRRPRSASGRRGGQGPRPGRARARLPGSFPCGPTTLTNGDNRRYRRRPRG